MAVDRHGILRTSFHWEALEQPAQMVHPHASIELAEHDWRGLGVEAQQTEYQRFLTGDRERGFALDRAPLMRLALLRVSNSDWTLVWSFHHLLLDGWCVPLILGEVFRFYEAAAAGTRLRMERPRPYRDYIEWLGVQDGGAAEAYWRGTLRGFQASTPLPPTDPAGHAGRGHQEVSVRLDAALSDELRNLARRQQVTLNTLLQGAWGLLLSRSSGECDVVFGATVSGRPRHWRAWTPWWGSSSILCRCVSNCATKKASARGFAAFSSSKLRRGNTNILRSPRCRRGVKSDAAHHCSKASSFLKTIPWTP